MTDPGDTEQGCYVSRGMSGFGVAVQLHRDEPMDEGFIRKMAEEVMLDIAHKCEAKGAKYIGHIKSHIRTEAGTVKADTLGHAEGAYSAGTISQPVTTLYMAINSILYGLEESGVRDATMDGLHTVADKFGLRVEKEKEHAYFDEFDYLKPDQEFVEDLEEQFDSEKSDPEKA